jgi:Arc/MetJ-type ribon-helix-helix transcriptional regulator
MRKVISISVSEKVHDLIREQAGYQSVSEYIRGLVMREHRRRQDAVQPVRRLRTANEA